jgi:hypothetical protein
VTNEERSSTIGSSDQRRTFTKTQELLAAQKVEIKYAKCDEIKREAIFQKLRLYFRKEATVKCTKQRNS